MKKILLLALTFLVNGSLLSAPLAVDADTIALYNFDTDTLETVTDSASFALEGQAYNTELIAIPDIDPDYLVGRRFTGNSYISFGSVSGSKLNFSGMSELSFEFVFSIDQIYEHEQIIFDNGQLKIIIRDGHIGAFVRQSGGMEGIVSTGERFNIGQVYRVQVVFANETIGLRIEGYNYSIQTSGDLIEGSYYNDEEVVIGKGFIGYLDDFRISGIARWDSVPPYIDLVTPLESVVTETASPIFNFLIEDNNDDILWFEIKLNNVLQPVENFVITPTGLQGQMAELLILGTNNIDIAVSDGSHNTTHKRFKIVYYDSNGADKVGFVETNGRTTCAVMLDGRVKCWGYNKNSEVGNISLRSSVSSPIILENCRNMTAISLGEIWSYGVGITADPNRFFGCQWGVDRGPLFFEGVWEREQKVGENHVCQLNGVEGSLRCGGVNEEGQLGLGHNESNWDMLEILTGALTVEAGKVNSCVIMQENGKVLCWGSGDFGQIGNGLSEDQYTPVEVSNIENAIAITVGDYHSCVVLSDNTTWCWGRNDYGQLGNNLSGSNSNTPVQVTIIDPARTVSKIVAAENFSCVILDNGEVQCWGRNHYGQLGDGTFDDTLTPVTSIGVANAINLSAEKQTACAVESNGILKCWGNNSYGQLGTGNFNDSSVPVVVNFSDVGEVLFLKDEIAGGDVHTCAIASDKTVRCWGDSMEGQLGNSYADQNINNSKGNPPFRVLESDHHTPLHDPKKISVGRYHSCAIMQDKRVKCWGDNRNGQLGDVPDTFKNYAFDVPMLADVADISAGRDYSCAVLENGKVMCFGGNLYGQLGNGTTASSHIPVEVSGINNAISVKASKIGYHTCAVLLDATVKCWGYNNYGQVGNQELDGGVILPYVKTPKEILNVSNVLEVSLGGDFTCLLFNDGKVKCLGRNNYGQLGDGNIRTASKVPVDVVNLEAVTKIESGLRHTCALISNGEIKCWGDNLEMQLGNGGVAPSSIPIKVINIETATTIGVGAYYSCAILEDNRSYCWGLNTTNALGPRIIDGGGHNSSVPREVAI